MTEKDKIMTEGGPTLFDGLEPQETPENGQNEAAEHWAKISDDKAATGGATERTTADEWAELFYILRETKIAAERAGIWLLFPTETLLRRAELYYNQRVDKICDTMIRSGATPDVVAVTCQDYVGVLCGELKFKATPQQMRYALRALKPYEAFTIDRYGLYFGLLMNYSRFLFRLRDYDEAVKGVLATEKTKREYIDRFFPAMDARAVRWLLNIGYMQPSDFAGIDPADMNVFFRRIAEYSALGEYTLYYTIARLALVATPQELAEVEAPPFLNMQTPIAVFCEQVLQETAENLDRAAEKFAEAVTSDTPTEQAQARRAGTEWHDDTNRQTVKIHENYGIVLSRPVNVSPNGSEIVNTLPVQRYIDEFNSKHKVGNLVLNATVTQMTVQKVFEGVNLLPQYLSGAMKVIDNGRFEFSTNISEFAEICGYADANQEQKNALLGGLLVLSNLYFVVDRPKKFAERINAKGRKVKAITGGRTALRFLNVPEIGIDSGALRIEVYPESLKGRPTIITAEAYKKLRAESKGLTQSRFNSQIATKSHKSERDLIDEVFGFADMLKYATAEDLPKVTKYVQGHRSRERERLLRWFDDYVKAGLITDFKRVPSKTDKRDFVLSWSCPDPSRLDPPPFDPMTYQAAEQ